MFRMYLDEVGNADMKASPDPNHRYLSLTGILMDLDYVHDVVSPFLEGIKRRFFASHCDEPIILHRKELINKNYPFSALREPAIEAAFNQELLFFLETAEYVVLTATIDKHEHLRRYSGWHFHPYHYCQEVILERYAKWMNRRDLRGDVWGESRGKKEDAALKDSFARICRQGSSQTAARVFSCICRQDIKLRRKADNTAGLQLADLVAHPSFKVMLAKKNAESLPENFGGKVGRILESSKYDRSPAGQVEGWGRKWLP